MKIARVPLTRRPDGPSAKPETAALIVAVDERITAKVRGNVVAFPVAPLSAEAIEAQKMARIRAYAKHITGPSHLESILADIPDPSTRGEVRALIVPLLSFTVDDGE